MSEDHLHRTTKSIKSRMTTIQQLKVIMLNKANTTSEVNLMKKTFERGGFGTRGKGERGRERAPLKPEDMYYIIHGK